MRKLSFASDYMRAAHPKILERLAETADMGFDGYGTDPLSEFARQKIREACGCPEAAVHFLVGGTQTNATVISALLRSYEGVLSADAGHIAVHEAGAVELGGHKVLTLPAVNGKLTASSVRSFIEAYYADANYEHVVSPGMVYISQPTESGTLYSRAELEALHEVCRTYGIPLYADGARLAYALACPSNDITLADLARLTDVFYIGGTKCGALFGEAVVIPKPELLPRFFTIMKQHGALLAKGWLLGLQFDTLFTNGLYFDIGKNAITAADRLRLALQAAGWPFHFDSPTNQIFLVAQNETLQQLEASVSFSVWEPVDETHTAIRLATSWATTEAEVDALIALLQK